MSKRSTSAPSHPVVSDPPTTKPSKVVRPTATPSTKSEKIVTQSKTSTQKVFLINGNGYLSVCPTWQSNTNKLPLGWSGNYAPGIPFSPHKGCINPVSGNPPNEDGPAMVMSPNTIGPASWPIDKPYPRPTGGGFLLSCDELSGGVWMYCTPPKVGISTAG